MVSLKREYISVLFRYRQRDPVEEILSKTRLDRSLILFTNENITKSNSNEL